MATASFANPQLAEIEYEKKKTAVNAVIVAVIISIMSANFIFLYLIGYTNRFL